MLLAVGLCSALLLTLWMLYGTYARLFSKGQTRVEHAQLCRALVQQIADDLRSAVQDPIGGAESESQGSAARRRFGLFGTSRELRFDVLQVTPTQGSLVPVGRASLSQSGTGAPRVPELRTVWYGLATPALAQDESLTNMPQGLVRRELDFESPADDLSDIATGLLAEQEAGAAVAGPSNPSDSLVCVPEVVSLQFRYFDGAGWSSEWNSLQRKSLPAAVEVVLGVAGSGPGLNTVAARGKALPAAAASEAHTPTYRLIVDLPASPSYRKTPPEAPERVEPRPVVRRIAPRRWTRPSDVRRLPEEWIRTRSP
jgi:hypothetical protein